jgi:hypothetical protein
MNESEQKQMLNHTSDRRTNKTQNYEKMNKQPDYKERSKLK